MVSIRDWKGRAESLEIRHQAFIDGRYVDAASGTSFDDVSPVDGRVLTQVAACDGEDVNCAVAAARRAFESGSWSRLAPAERTRMLQRIADQTSTPSSIPPGSSWIDPKRRSGHTF